MVGRPTWNIIRCIAASDELAYQLSNDGSVYVLPEEQPIHEPTEEELEEMKRQRNISELESQIRQKKEKLAQTDYIPVKLYEYFLAGKECTEYEISEVLRRGNQSVMKSILWNLIWQS